MADQPDPRTRARFPWWVVGVAVLVVALAAVWAVRRRAAPAGGGQAASTGAQPGGGGPGGRGGGGTAGPGAPGGGQRAVPVTVAAAARKDVPIYLEGIGNVVANRTVTVRPQVDGRLDAVLFREGQDVRQGQVLAQIDPRPFQAQLHQAEGALARDQAQLRNAQLNVERDRQLVAQKLVAQSQLDADTAAAGQLDGAIRIDQAAIETARLNLSYARITSPIDGVAGIRQVDPGNVVHATDANGIVVLTQLDPIALIFALPQDQLGPVAAQQARGPLPVDAYSRDGATLLASGQLVVIDNQINQTTSTIRLKAIVPNPKRVLWPNQFVNARLRLETRKDALVVPATAIQRGPNGTFVYVVASDDTAALRPVAIDVAEGDLVLLSKGVSEGERVVVDGQNQLRPGAKVAPRPATRAGGSPVASDGAATPAAGGTPR